MTTQILTRLDANLKKKFEKIAQKQGLSMNFLITTFIQIYTKNPKKISLHVDDTMFDEIVQQSFSSPKAIEATASLHSILKEK